MKNININKIVIISSLLIIMVLSFAIKAQAIDFDEWTIIQKYNKTDPKWIALNQFKESGIDSAKRKITADLTKSNNNNVITSKAVPPQSTAVNESIIESKLFRTILFCEVFVLITALFDAVKNKRFYHVRIPFIIKIVIAIVKFAIMFVVTTFILHFMVLIAEVYNMQEYVLLGIVLGAILILAIWLVKVVYFTPYNVRYCEKVINDVDSAVQMCINLYVSKNPEDKYLSIGLNNYYFRFLFFCMLTINIINEKSKNRIISNPKIYKNVILRYIKRFDAVPFNVEIHSDYYLQEAIQINNNVWENLKMLDEINSERHLAEAMFIEYTHLCFVDTTRIDQLKELWQNTYDRICYMTYKYIKASIKNNKGDRHGKDKKSD